MAIARQSLEVAERIESAIFATVDWLAAHPTLGTKTDEQNVRRWPMTDLRYAIFYRIDGRRLRNLKQHRRRDEN